MSVMASLAPVTIGRVVPVAVVMPPMMFGMMLAMMAIVVFVMVAVMVRRVPVVDHRRRIDIRRRIVHDNRRMDRDAEVNVEPDLSVAGMGRCRRERHRADQ